ncbi:MAG: transposase [Pararobbsia sp.]
MEPILSTEAAKRSSRKGRPNNPIEFRRQLAQRACEPGVSVARLAMEHGLNTNLLFKWRRAYRAGEYDGGALVPVALVDECATPANTAPPLPAPSAPASSPTGVIEIRIGTTRIRVDGRPDAATLQWVLRTLAAPRENP